MRAIFLGVVTSLWHPTNSECKIKLNVGGTVLMGAWLALINPEPTFDLRPAVTAAKDADDASISF